MSHVHRVPPHAVDRPALRTQLDIGAAAPLTVVVAPPGSGKTVLLSQWVHSRPARSSVWIDIGRADADAAVFARHLVQAVAEIDESMNDLDVPVGTPECGVGDPFIEAFTTELAQLGDLVVVFDDVHCIVGSAIVSDLARVIDRLPPNAHFVLSSRVDLQFGWSRHRLAHGLVELRQEQLAFDDGVTARVIEHITGAKVDEATAAAVRERTEGWAAGVQLSALTLRSGKPVEEFTESLAGTNRLILDYLTEEVFEAQTPARLDALTRLSTVDALCAGLAESLVGLTNGLEFLRELERESMFIAPVPERAGWYRFHPLFRDVLRYRLRATAPELEGELLKTAADWHLLHADTETAVEYLLRAHAWDAVCDLLLASGRDVYERPHAATVSRWLSLIPEDVRWAEPQVELLFGMVAAISGRGGLAVEIIQHLLAADVLDPGNRQVALTYFAKCVYSQPHPERFRDVAQRSLALLARDAAAPRDDLLHLTSTALLETMSYLSLGRAQLLLGELSAARAATEAALAAEGSGYGPYRVQVMGTLAVIEAGAGRLTRATELADGALELARELGLLAHPAPADAHLALAIVAIQRSEFETGAHSLHEGAIRAAASQRTQQMWIARVASTLIDPRGTSSAALDPHGPPPPAVSHVLAALEWRRARSNGLPRDPRRRPELQWSALAFEQVAALLERGLTAEARVFLTQCRHEPDSKQPVATVEHEIARAWLAADEGHATESRVRLESALELAESEWLAYPVIAAGPRVHALVAGLPGSAGAFRQRIVRAGGARAEALSRLSNPPTARELELLEYLPTRLTSQEIAARWYVSVNTIKTHLGHLYRKLGVADRDAAVERAREWGLLEESKIPHSG